MREFGSVPIEFGTGLFFVEDARRYEAPKRHRGSRIRQVQLIGLTGSIIFAIIFSGLRSIFCLSNGNLLGGCWSKFGA